MKCPKCGSEVQESKFCSECGAPLTDEAVVQEKAQASSKKKPKKKRGCCTVFLVFFALTLIGGFLTAIEDPQYSQSSSAGKQAASMQSGSTEIPSAEKQAEIDAALAKLTKNADEVENSAYYMPSCYPEYANSRSFALPYIGKKMGIIACFGNSTTPDPIGCSSQMWLSISTVKKPLQFRSITLM